MLNFTINIYFNKRIFQDTDKQYTIDVSGGDIPVIKFEDIILVAQLQLNDVEEDYEQQFVLDVVYGMTQNREKQLWSKRPEIQILTEQPLRSTAIGDVFEWSGYFWMVAPLGFVEIFPQK